MSWWTVAINWLFVWLIVWSLSNFFSFFLFIGLNVSFCFHWWLVVQLTVKMLTDCFIYCASMKTLLYQSLAWQQSSDLWCVDIWLIVGREKCSQEGHCPLVETHWLEYRPLLIPYRRWFISLVVVVAAAAVTEMKRRKCWDCLSWFPCCSLRKTSKMNSLCVCLVVVLVVVMSCGRCSSSCVVVVWFSLTKTKIVKMIK